MLDLDRALWRNSTPSSPIVRNCASDMTWNPPESVRIA